MSNEALAVYAVVVISSGALAFEIRAAAARLHYGLAIADDSFLTVNKTGYQDALTDPAGNKWAILRYVLTLGSWVGAGVLLGWYHVLLALVVSFVTVNAVMALLPAPNDPRYFKRLHASLCRREADYRRDGDLLRADACVFVRELLEDRYDPGGTPLER